MEPWWTSLRLVLGGRLRRLRRLQGCHLVATNSLRIELEKQGTLVTGVHLGYTDTDMISEFDVPKNDPREVAREIVDGIERGDAEVLADDITRQVKAALSGPVEALRVS